MFQKRQKRQLLCAFLETLYIAQTAEQKKQDGGHRKKMNQNLSLPESVLPPGRKGKQLAEGGSKEPQIKKMNKICWGKGINAKAQQRLKRIDTSVH